MMYDATKVKAVYIGQPDGKAKKFVPIRHGKWRQTRMTLMADYYMCSECGVELRIDFITDLKMPPVTYNYCPNCGAKMDGE